MSRLLPLFLPLSCFLFLSLLLLPCSSASVLIGRVALRGGINYPVVTGAAQFTQSVVGGPVTIVANLSGLAPGEYGWHIHQFGDESSGRSTNSNNGDIDPTIVGTHFDNGAHPLHGCWPSGDRHTGDLGNLTITEFDRINTFTIVRDLIDLSPTSNSSIIGRMLIIHRNYDVCIQPTGGAGVMLAQGVIGIGDPAQYGSEANNTAGIQLPWTDESPSESVVAVGVFHPTTIGASGSSVVSGTVYLSQLTHVAGLTDQLRVMVNLSGLEPWSSHGLHIHEWGDDSTGGHFNPYGRTHGLPSMDADYRHAGDLGNVLADANGYAMSDFVVDAVSLVGLPNVLGRSLVLQSAPDTGEADSYAAVGFTRSTNAIAQAVIGLTTYRPPARLSSGWFARATIRGSTAYPLVSATVTFSQPQGPGLYSPTTITGTFFNLPLGKDGASTSYALHIHEFGDLTSDPIDLTVVGGHFNPLNKPHGCPPNIDRHAGDIGNVAVTSTATFTATFINPLIDLADSIKSVIGRSLVLHNGTDRCVQPAGNSGTPIASGVIGIVAPPIAGYINKANNIFINQTASLIARLYPTKDGPGIGGTIQMAMDQTKRFRVIVTINGLTPFTSHGLHLYDFGIDLSSAAASELGGHFNPESMPHDLPNPISHARHLGDLGSLTADAAGECHADFTVDFSSPVFNGVHQLRGRGVVLRSVADSGLQPFGDAAGVHLARGVIGLSNRAMPPEPTAYASFCDKYAGLLGMNHTFFIQSALIRAIYGVDAARTGMRFPDGFGPPALHEVPGCVTDQSPIRDWFNGNIGYRTKRSPYPLYPPTPDYSTLNTVHSRRLISHLTQYFALSLGCSEVTIGAYEGVENMHAVHANMYLTQASFSYFTSQLRLGFTSFGCLDSDVASSLLSLTSRFLRGGSDDSTNAICTEPDCRCATNLCGADCTAAACQTSKVNGTIPTYTRGYVYQRSEATINTPIGITIATAIAAIATIIAARI